MLRTSHGATFIVIIPDQVEPDEKKNIKISLSKINKEAKITVIPINKNEVIDIYIYKFFAC